MLSILSLALAPALSPAAGNVWIVDAELGPGAHFAEIQDAVDRASSGDVVLVHPGSYGGFEIRGKSLVVTAAENDLVELYGTVSVRGLAAGQAVSLRGLVKPIVSEVHEAGFHLEDNAGSVWLESCEFWTGWDEEPGLRPSSILSSASVVLNDCFIHGGIANATACVGVDGGAGIWIQDSSVALYGCILTAGKGSSSGCSSFELPPAAVGGDGLLVSGSTVELFDTVVYGGLGGWAPQSPSGTCGVAGAGGPALRLLDRGTELAIFASTLVPGPGNNLPPQCPAGQAATPIVGSPASLTEAAHGVPSLSLPNPSVAGESIVASVGSSGLPAELVLVWGVEAMLPQLGGGTLALHLLPAGLWSVGTAQGAAPLATTVPTPRAPAGTALTLLLQPLSLGTNEAILGPPTTWTLLGG